ncbi:hypothetical protein Taro_015772 [Colocasia esculenta]|uniref:Uncharacterized protein n=1 Tax=Colocasia esculenta TaxID=4460 RepID=A0A843UM41_COLES|nr:hypothetical protein [Colocasia esculenta]
MKIDEIDVTWMFLDEEDLQKCVDTRADCVDTTGYCFRTGFWDSELVSTHRLKGEKPPSFPLPPLSYYWKRRKGKQAVALKRFAVVVGDVFGRRRTRRRLAEMAGSVRTGEDSQRQQQTASAVGKTLRLRQCSRRRLAVTAGSVRTGEDLWW